MLDLANSRGIDLENFCFYCKIIKSNQTFHCTYCKRCVERFDHHCVYINNCLGHQNHKHFVGFLFLITVYFICSTTVCLVEFSLHAQELEMDSILGLLDIIAISYTLVVNMAQALPLL